VSSAGLSSAERRLGEEIVTERALVGSGMFESPSPFSYLTLTSMMRDEYRRIPEPLTEAVTYTLFALNSWAPSETRAGPRGSSQGNLPTSFPPVSPYLSHCARLWTHVSTQCFSLPST
jgi:hypothetical protein